MSTGGHQGGSREGRAKQANVAPVVPVKSRAQSSEQERAKAAWEWVAHAKKLDNHGRYGTLSRKLPSYLQTSGFEQTMAYLFSKSDGSDKKPEGLLFIQLARHTLTSIRWNGTPLNSIKQMMDAVVNLSMDESRRAAHEAMRISEWLRRFAPVELGEEKS